MLPRQRNVITELVWLCSISGGEVIHMLSAAPFQVLRASDAYCTGTHYTVDSRSIEQWMDEIQDTGRIDTTPYLSLPSKIEVFKTQ